jgi:hypothetical protein
MHDLVMLHIHAEENMCACAVICRAQRASRRQELTLMVLAHVRTADTH